jgi:hypothetical protein
MDSLSSANRPTDDATEFVRFCYRRRRVGWPELYDEMCLVASRGLYRGWGTADLAENGIGFSLFETAALAGLVVRVIAEDRERLGRDLRRNVEGRRTETDATGDDDIVASGRTRLVGVGVGLG